MWSSLPRTNGQQSQKTDTLDMLKLSISSLILLLSPTLIWAQQVPAVSNPIGETQVVPSEVQAAPLPLTPSPQETASLLLHSALNRAVWGDAVTCKIRQRITLLDKQLVGVGTYAHGGGGRGELMLHVRFPAADQMNTLMQVSDGRVLYTIENLGVVSQRSRIDLNRIHERLGVITAASLEDPVIALYLAVGGQAELLRKIVQQYRWKSVQSGKLGNHEVWWLGGELATEPPPVRAFAEVDNLLFLPNNSTMLPTKIRVALGKKDPVPLWLYQVEQSRDDALSGIKSRTPLHVVTEFLEPNLVKQLPENIFQIQSSNDTIIEETRRYLPPHSLAQIPDMSAPSLR